MIYKHCTKIYTHDEWVDQICFLLKCSGKKIALAGDDVTVVRIIFISLNNKWDSDDFFSGKTKNKPLTALTLVDKLPRKGQNIGTAPPGYHLEKHDTHSFAYSSAKCNESCPLREWV